MRLAKIGVHDYLCCHVLAAKGKILASDIPSLSLSDAELKVIFKEIKKHFPKDRDDSKHIVHGSNYLATPPLISTMYEIPLAETERIQDIYFERVAAKVKAWQQLMLEKAHHEVWLTNPFFYKIPFWEIFRWNSQRYERLLSTWRKLDGYAPNGMRWTLTRVEQGWIDGIREWMAKGMTVEDAISKLCYDLGDDAKSAISFLPRDTAAAMLKEALLRLRPLAFSNYNNGHIVACAHDSTLCDVPKSRVDEVARLLHTEMTRPVSQLQNLIVDVEVKVGQAWDSDSMEVLEMSPVAAQAEVPA
jgi:hypothetical protein